jgi:hypothetical protein
MGAKKQILNFNHISKDNEHSETLQEFYRHYHKLEFCFNKKFHKYKIFNLILDGISATIIGVSTSTAITINPLISILSVSSLACQYAKKKFKFAEKCENYRQATILINRILVDLKSHIREPTCDKAKITEQLKIYDDKLLDIVKIPSIHKYEKMYNKEFEQ